MDDDFEFKKVKIKFLGNYKDFENGEIYDVDEPCAMAYVVLGIAIFINE